MRRARGANAETSSRSHVSDPFLPRRRVAALGLRYARQDIAVSADGVLRPDGSMEFGKELLPELNLRWVSTPAEACLWQREALEVTVMAAGEKVLGQWARRAHITIGKYGYLFLATSPLPPLATLPTQCGEPANWVLVRDGWLHPAPVPEAGTGFL
jgi:hypothetical protein